MALSLHHESEKHDEFQAGLMRSGSNRGYFQQRDKFSSGTSSSLQGGHGQDSKYYHNMADVTNQINRQHPNATNDKYLSGYKNGQMYSLDHLQDAFSSYGIQQQDNHKTGGGGGGDPAYYCPWNVDGPFDAVVPTFSGRGTEGDLGSVLDRSLNGGDKFGLNSSTASSGFGALDDLVSKIVEDDQSLFGSFNGMVDGRNEHDMNNFDRSSNVNFNSVWSSGSEAATSTPAGKQTSGSLFDSDSIERPSRPADYLWDTSGSASSGSFLQDGSFLDSLYSPPGASSGDGSPNSHLPQHQHQHHQQQQQQQQQHQQQQQQQQAAKERFRYTKHLFNKGGMDGISQRDFDQNGAGDGKPGFDRHGDYHSGRQGDRHGDSRHNGNNNAYYNDMMYDMMKGGADPAMHMHNQMAGSASSQSDINMSSFSGQVPANSSLDAAWSLANLPDIPGVDKHLLAQALMSQASNALLNAELACGKDKLLDSLMRLNEKAQPDREGGASGPGANSNGGSSGGSLVTPIRVMTQQNNGTNGSYHSGAASVNTWSNPSTPNSGAESTGPSGPEPPSGPMQGHRSGFPQKSFPNKFSVQNGRGSSNSNHTPLPTGYEKRPGSSSFQGPPPPGGGFRGRGMPFPFPRHRHVCDPSGDAKPGPLERHPQSGPFPLPEHLSPMERGAAPFPKDFPGMAHHHRSHLIEDMFPHDHPGMGPFPSHMKYPHNLPAHLPPEAYEYFPYDPYLQGCLAPTFFGPNDMFFDMIPPHFYGLPHFFPGFKPPRRTGPSNELHIRLEECYDQFKNLERERKKTEAELARQNPGKKVSSANNIVIPRLPSNPSRVDRLVVDSLREHARVQTLIQKMEKLRGEPMHANIHSAMDTWMEGIRKVQARRKEEIINATNRHRNGGPRYQEEKDVLALATSINELTNHTRRARTAMWCALQSSLKDVPASTLHHLRPSELAAHDAANQQTAALTRSLLSSPNDTASDTATEAESGDSAGQPLPTISTVTGKGADDNNNAQPADVGVGSVVQEAAQVK